MNVHVVARKTSVLVCLALLGLLALTYGVSHVNLGDFNIVIALAIAFMKMMLVVLFFMELRWSSRLTWVVAAAGLFWFVLLVTLTLSDVITRIPVSLPGS